MRLIIDIPEVTCQEVRWRGLYLCPRDIDALVSAIKNGKPYEERPHGEWIFTGRKNAYGGSEIECSNCHTKLMVSPSRWEIGENFCDVCGSHNKKEGGEN